MNSERKNYPMKEFQAIFPISSILVIRSWNAKKDHFSILAVFQNVWYLHKFWLQIWIQNAKNTLWKNFGQIFRFHNFGHFWILAVLQNIWDLHKFGLQIWIQNAKITLWKNFGQFFRFHRFWSSGPGMQKKIISILAVIQKIWDHKFGLQIWIQNAKITLWKNFGQFFRFHHFGHQVLVCWSFLNISCNSKWDLHKFGLQIWIQNAKNYPMKEFRAIFPISPILVIRSGYAKKDHLNISCNSKYMGFT